jgi:hypothetical protein
LFNFEKDFSNFERYKLEEEREINFHSFRDLYLDIGWNDMGGRKLRR